MVFNSLEFAIFLPIVFIVYWLVNSKRIRTQNVFLILASYLFYGWWDWRFLILIAFSTVLDYLMGLLIDGHPKGLRRKFYLWMSVGFNLGLLGVFKYYNFFVENFVEAFSLLGLKLNLYTLNIILPVGISFYTFQTMSYTIDVYKGRISSTRNFIAFAAFVSFFPQLVAGPIERAAKLLPQFIQRRVFDYKKAVDGLRQVLWGLFKKVVIADNCAEIVNPIFDNPSVYSGSVLMAGAFFFTIQIYTDFSGYSDMAIGLARLFGFELSKNFSFPYFSRSMPETWTRWHISLTTWFRDYLYVPLALKYKKNRAALAFLMIFQFLVIGFWHGASWNFLLWGLVHALIMLPYTINRGRKPKYRGDIAKDRLIPSLNEFLLIVRTFVIINLTMVVFRTSSIDDLLVYFKGMLSLSFFYIGDLGTLPGLVWTILLVLIFLALEWIGRRGEYGLDHLLKGRSVGFRYAFYYLLVFSIFIFSGDKQQYIYFQF